MKVHDESSLLFFAEVCELSSDGPARVILITSVGQCQVRLEGVPLPLDEGGGLVGDGFVRRLRHGGDASRNLLMGHFQRVATATRHIPCCSLWLLLLLLLLLIAVAAHAGRVGDLTRLENVPRETFKQIETTQL